MRAGALEAPEWTHDDSMAAHRLIKTIRDGVQEARGDSGALGAAYAADLKEEKPGDFEF